MVMHINFVLTAWFECVQLIVNKSYQAFPAYRITYNLNRQLPNPIKEGKQALQTLDESKDTAFHHQAVLNGLL